jgi:hypothetical protein
MKKSPQTRSANDTITPPANFCLLRNPLIESHLPRQVTPLSPPIVRFGPARTDNQSAGKLRLGFQPHAAAHARGSDNRPRSSTIEYTDERHRHRFPGQSHPTSPWPSSVTQPSRTLPGSSEKATRDPDTTGQNRTTPERSPSCDLPRKQRVGGKSTALELPRKILQNPDKRLQTDSLVEASGPPTPARFFAKAPAASHPQGSAGSQFCRVIAKLRREHEATHDRLESKLHTLQERRIAREDRQRGGPRLDGQPAGRAERQQGGADDAGRGVAGGVGVSRLVN